MLLPSSGICSTPLTWVGDWDAGGLQDRGGGVDDVMELGAQSRLHVAGPAQQREVAGAAEVRGDLLHPLKRRGPGVCPTDGVVVLVQP
jgi:hypothetical protein